MIQRSLLQTALLTHAGIFRWKTTRRQCVIGPYTSRLLLTYFFVVECKRNAILFSSFLEAITLKQWMKPALIGCFAVIISSRAWDICQCDHLCCCGKSTIPAGYDSSSFSSSTLHALKTFPLHGSYGCRVSLTYGCSLLAMMYGLAPSLSGTVVTLFVVN